MSKYATNSQQRTSERDSPLQASASASAPLNQRNSILDPHLSVLQLLERAEQPTTTQSELAPLKRHELVRTPSPAKMCVSEAMNRSISESWQSIRRTDYSILHVLNEASSNHQPVGILSSSDTSEDEPDHFLSPSPNNYTFGAASAMLPEPPHALEAPPLSTLRNSGLQTTQQNDDSLHGGDIDSDIDNDNETVTLSLMNSSNSFVMPKLSLFQQSQKFCILIVGKPAQRFFRDIPKSYQKLFDVCDVETLSSHKVKQYSAVMIIFSDPKNGQTLLEKVAPHNINIIAVCQRGQQQQISNLLSRFSKSNQMRLVYHLTVMSDHQDVHRMLRYLHSLSSEVESGYETEVGSRKIRKRRKSQRKRPANLNISRWVVWSISLTVGVGIGYCISCVLSSAVSSRSGDFSMRSADNVTFLEDVSMSSPDGTFDSYVRQLVLAFRKAIKQANLSFKQYLNGQSLLVMWMQRMGKEWMSEDSDTTLPGVAALDLVLI